MISISNRLRVCVFCLVAGTGTSTFGQSIGQVPLPVIETGATVHLRVAYVYNPRLDGMSIEQLEKLLAATKRYAASHFELDLDFQNLDVIAIDSLFAKIDGHIARDQMTNAYRFRDPNNPARPALVESVASCLNELSDDQIEQMRAFAKPYLAQAPASTSLESFAESLVDTQLIRIEQWLKIFANDGHAVIDNQPFNEWQMWVALGYTNLPYDVILTNQLVASTEYHHCSAHTIIRGGISVGGTNYSRSGPYQGFVFLSTYPFTSNAGTLPSLRGNDVYTKEEAGVFAGAYLTHEIGHLLFHFRHPFGETRCVMNPSSLLRFREWYQEPNEQRCPSENQPQITPGAYQFLYKRYETP